jgi:hexokinase
VQVLPPNGYEDTGESSREGASVVLMESGDNPVSQTEVNVDDASEHGVIDIAVDGSVVEFYPGFENYMREALRSVDGIGPAGEKKIRIGIAKDGSSVGAAIIALLATKSA